MRILFTEILTVVLTGAVINGGFVNKVPERKVIYVLPTRLFPYYCLTMFPKYHIATTMFYRKPDIDPLDIFILNLSFSDSIGK